MASLAVSGSRLLSGSDGGTLRVWGTEREASSLRCELLYRCRFDQRFRRSRSRFGQSLTRFLRAADAGGGGGGGTLFAGGGRTARLFWTSAAVSFGPRLANDGFQSFLPSSMDALRIVIDCRNAMCLTTGIKSRTNGTHLRDSKCKSFVIIQATWRSACLLGAHKEPHLSYLGPSGLLPWFLSSTVGYPATTMHGYVCLAHRVIVLCILSPNFQVFDNKNRENESDIQMMKEVQNGLGK